jgi:hypothetical protein
MDQEITKESGMLLRSLDRGIVNINAIRNFLAKVESYAPPAGRKEKRIDRVAGQLSRLDKRAK